MHVYPHCVVLLYGSICAIMFLWSLLSSVAWKHLFSITLLSPLSLCVRGCQRWWQENSAHWEETVSHFGLLVVPSYGGLSSHAVVVMPKVCLASPYMFPFFLSLSLVAHILQSFQTVTQFHTVNVTLVTCKATLCVWCSVGLIWDFPYCGVQCMIARKGLFNWVWGIAHYVETPLHSDKN